MPGGQERASGALSAEVNPKAILEQGIERLLQELAQGKSGRLEQYLAFSAKFHQYSLHNQMLISLQCPQATYVAGYKRWQEMGYQVAKGQKGIRILAPRPHKRVNQETGAEETAVSFVPVSVFDASQLANVAEKPLPIFFTPLADDQEALFERLTQVVRQDGISILEKDTGRAQGYSSGGQIALKQGLDSRSKVLVLLHEYTHELLHQKDVGKTLPKPVKECHAEAVSYIVAYHFNIHNPFSSDYLQRWGTTRDTLMTELELVRVTARTIIDRLHASEPEVAMTSRGGSASAVIFQEPVPSA